MKKNYQLKKSIKDLPFREWLNDNVEVYIYKYNNELKAINGICPHFYGQLELNQNKNEIKCNFHHLKICPATLASNSKKFKKIQEYKIISTSPIIIEI